MIIRQNRYDRVAMFDSQPPLSLSVSLSLFLTIHIQMYVCMWLRTYLASTAKQSTQLHSLSLFQIALLSPLSSPHRIEPIRTERKLFPTFSRPVFVLSFSLCVSPPPLPLSGSLSLALSLARSLYFSPSLSVVQ